ncbi:sensor histidine kinase [Paenibacillus alvei]|uniref:sensor histidine kinase n=1 Tax=Paenibacillus alvei TaxID=44250 RepID=UPI000289B056|nr:sensor histidine kinase [Paenibacillus alvei]EJW15916.1 integral membrane sensor signal transduction histidine kinase [Paenibacillus alvei DSM 29]MCY9544058.1 sensor histidine kinase [Paenibacillus alvei]MCY9734331.1 sensor histidine kinase [Paenibacillus alvei]MCY9754772.1 sensor histidine kinase [Paenibacillus alvei]MEC0083025.1 sensor histidine kinase [Paenibacillus alvei]
MKIDRYSLRTKLVIAALMCFMIPLIVNYFLTTYVTKDIVLHKAVSSTQDTLILVDSNVSGIVEQMLSLSNIILMNNEINKHVTSSKEQFASGNNSGQQLDYMRLISNLDDLFAQNSDMYITVLGVNGFTYTNYSFSDFNPNFFNGKIVFKELDKLAAFSTAWIGLQDNYYGNFEAKQKSPKVLTIARTMKNSSGHSLGYVIVSVNESKIQRQLNSYSEQRIMLLDDQGAILSQSDSINIGQQFRYHDYAINENTLVYNNEKYIYVSEPVAGTKWSLLSLVPYSSAVGPNNQILVTSFIMQFLFFTGFCILLMILISAITNPITKLSKFVSKVNMGQLSIRSGIRGQHEVGQLGKSIDQMLDRIEMMIEQITLEQTKKRKAELEMLQAQINPHFMFNLLNSIRLNILIRGDEENAKLIGSLSSLLRMTINRDNEWISLRDEVETIQHYIRLMNFRHANQVQLIEKIVVGSEHVFVPRFMIQPIIENAIIHGFHQYGGQIEIESYTVKVNEESSLLIKIHDNGVGMTPERLQELITKLEKGQRVAAPNKSGFSGIGVTNVYQRLKLIYGEKFLMRINSEVDVGTTITLQLPQVNREVE